MTIWIFGDSFSDPVDHKNDHNTWYDDLAAHYNQPVENYSKFGAGHQYIMSLWDAHYKNIKPDDYVIILLTSIRKTFFFKDNPITSMPWMVSKPSYNAHWNRLPEEKRTAFDSYYEHLHHDHDISLQIKSFLFWVDKVSEKLTHKIIIIKAFNEFYLDASEFKNLVISSGTSLIELSKLEVSRDEWNKLLINQDCFDHRSNHLSAINHKHLKNCIVESLSTNKLDLAITKFTVYNGELYGW